MFYYMARSVSRQDEPNRTLWLASRAGKIELSCPLGNYPPCPGEKFPRKPNNKSFIDQTFSVKMAGYWPHSFLQFMDFDSFSVHKLAKKELGQYPAILTSHLVNNPYTMTIKQQYVCWGQDCSQTGMGIAFLFL